MAVNVVEFPERLFQQQVIQNHIPTSFCHDLFKHHDTLFIIVEARFEQICVLYKKYEWIYF